MLRLRLLALCLLVGCSDRTGPAQEPSPPAALAKTTGDRQNGVVGEALLTALGVRVEDGRRRPIADVEVVWGVLSGGGNISPVTRTGPDGVAQAHWTLGSAPGEQVVTAIVDGTEPVTFVATAVPGAVAAITISPDSAIAAAGQDTQLTALAKDRFGNSLSAAIVWQSADTAIASVSNAGVVSAKRSGTTVVVARYGAAVDSAKVRVVPGPPSSSTLAPTDTTVEVGFSFPLRLSVNDAWGNSIPVGANGNWSSSDTQVASVDSIGRITAHRVGTATVTFRLQTAVSTMMLVVRPVSVPFRSVYGGGTHTCSVAEGGQAYCWGRNEHGQLGNTSRDQCLNNACNKVPTAVSGPAFDVVQAGQLHTCGLASTQEIYCWGWNPGSQVGDGTTESRNVPTKVMSNHRFRQLSVGHQHNCAISVEGEVYCWGHAFGSVPTKVATPLQFTVVSVGAAYACATTSAADAYCWGQNSDGRLGDGTTQNRSTPVPISGGHKFVNLSAGVAHACGLLADGSAYCWGRNGDGQLGNDTRQGSSVPIPVATATRFRAITAGDSHTCAISLEGAAFCWGAAAQGRLGFQVSGSWALVPTQVNTTLRFVTLDVGGPHTCGIATDAATYCWGGNNDAVLGVGTEALANRPTRTAVPRN